MHPQVSVIIIHFGSTAYTETLVGQLAGFPATPPREVIVVDNASEHPFPAARFPEVRTIRLTENRGYGYACNRGADAARGEYFFILNNDLEFPRDVLPSLIDTCAHLPRPGAVGPALRFPDGRFQLSWGSFPTLRSEFQERRRQQQSRSGGGKALEKRAGESAVNRSVDWITGACMLIPRKAWEDVGGFDERYFFYFEDVDLCTRLRFAGYEVCYQPSDVVLHHGGGSDPMRNPAIVLSYRREQLRYYARYNSHLSFALLRRYLLRKFERMGNDAVLSASQKQEILELIRSFSRTEERRHIQAWKRSRR
jgi:GT2 family glycosyltransferase